MKKIGFIDYYISEWHANNYPAWIKEINAELGTDFVLSYAWAEEDVSLIDGKTTDEWCKKFHVERCASIAELCEKSDCILILSPSNPEKHLAYAEQALKYGKPTYIDKTFAPDYATAKKIYEIAERYSTPMFSTSALRYADEIAKYNGDAKNIFTTGGGRAFGEYAVHQIEMAVKTLGTGAKRVKAEREVDRITCRIEFEGGRASTIMWAYELPFNVFIAGADGVTFYHSVKSDFFKSLIRDILRFYDSKTPSFDKAQTMEVIKIRDAALKAIENERIWQEV